MRAASGCSERRVDTRQVSQAIKIIIHLSMHYTVQSDKSDR